MGYLKDILKKIGYWISLILGVIATIFMVVIAIIFKFNKPKKDDKTLKIEKNVKKMEDSLNDNKADFVSDDDINDSYSAWKRKRKRNK